jgi:hypothetical protein
MLEDTQDQVVILQVGQKQIPIQMAVLQIVQPVVQVVPY